MDITEQKRTWEGFIRYTKAGIAASAVLVLFLLWMYVP